MYRTVAQIDSATGILASWFPQLFTRVQLPEASVQGRAVYALRMRAGSGTGRRGVLVVGGTHARELMNPDAIIDLAIDLLLSYSNGTNIRYGGKTFAADDVKLILEAMDIWLLPCVNPDGRHHVMTVDDMWRKNRRDNPGTPCDGVDLNRNADVVWGVAQGQTSCSPCSEVYCGPSAFSEPETRNVKHLLDSERIVSFVDVHSFSELVLYPWGHAPTQSTDSTRRFTGLPTGTCTASIPSTYAEYMPPRDVQRFRTVAGRIVSDIAAVRGRRYTPQTSFALYATTGTQGDYAYARHIANPGLRKTYGFTFETGPNTGNAAESFHPADPALIKRDAKAAILSLLQQSVCAIELIGLRLFGGDTEAAALRTVRDDLLATTAAGREWIALFERAQFAVLSAAVRDANVVAAAGELIRVAARSVRSKNAVFGEADGKRASALLKALRGRVKNRELQRDLDAVGARIEQLAGRRMQQVIESLMKSRPGKAGKATAAKKRGRAKKRA
ncbi:MAG: M14 family zinc carboxypeptidase [Burkholderiales bacterium]